MLNTISRDLIARVISSLLIFIPFQTATALDKNTIGEECYDILHDEELENSDEYYKCLDKLDEQTTTLVVTPMRRVQNISESPASISVLGAKDIQRSSADSLAELVRDVPGVEITDSGQAGLKRIRIRGEESRRIAILIDGQEFADEREVGTPILIAPEMIERIEILRGTSSVLHGSRGIGGVINIITKKGGYHPIQGTLSSSYDSATDGHQLFGSFFGSIEGFDYRISATDADHENRETAQGEIDSTSYENDSISAYIAKKFTEHRIAVSFDNYNASSEVYVEPEVATTPPFLDFQIDAPQRDRMKTALFYDWEHDGEVFRDLHFDIYFQRSDRQFNTFSDLELDFGQGAFVRNSDVYNDSTLDTLGANLQAEFALNSHTIVVGAELKEDSLEQVRRRELTESAMMLPTEVVNDEARQSSIELFAQDELALNDSLALIAGSRAYLVDSELESTTREGLEPNSTDDFSAIFSLGIKYLLDSDTTFWSTWSQGYVFPSLINLSTGAFAGPDYVSPNQSLDPETSNSFDLGIRTSLDKLTVETSAFYTRARNYIDHVRCSTTDVNCLEPSVGRRDRVFVNIDKAQTFGAELATSYELSENLNPYVNASWIRRRFQSDSISSYDTGVPTFSTRLGVRMQTKFSSTARGWLDFYIRSATNSSESSRDGDEVENKAGWGTSNLSLGYALTKKQNIKLIFDFLNLGDKNYTNSTENLPARGRSAIVKVVASL